jgi:hypothetical protein
MRRWRENRKKNAVRGRLSWRHLAIALALVVPASILVLWFLVNRVTWLGPWVADGLRAVIGVDNVSKLEDFAYDLQDRVNRVVRKDEAPRAYWAVPSATEPPPALPSAPPHPSALSNGAPPTETVPSTTASGATGSSTVPPFRPEDVGPALQSWSAPGDGQWVPMPSDVLPGQPARMWKTLIHPDKSRSWAEVFVVALDLRQLDVHLVAGRKEPVATEEPAMNLERPGTIPEADRGRALAAFNGGFKTEHGGYGMRLSGVTYVKAKPKTCTVARYGDRSMKVASWESVQATEPDMLWWRQAPNCMVLDGKVHPLLMDGYEKNWGAQLDGKTVIRRSAIGMDATNQILFVSITNHTTARVLAEGMRHVGARTVAQLDVNFSFPKFVTFEPNAEQTRVAIALAEGFEFGEDEFIRARHARDFFYVTPRP